MCPKGHLLKERNFTEMQYFLPAALVRNQVVPKPCSYCWAIVLTKTCDPSLAPTCHRSTLSIITVGNHRFDLCILDSTNQCKSRLPQIARAARLHTASEKKCIDWTRYAVLFFCAFGTSGWKWPNFGHRNNIRGCVKSCKNVANST